LGSEGIIEHSFALILMDDGGKYNRIFAPIRFSDRFGRAAGLQAKDFAVIFPFLGYPTWIMAGPKGRICASHSVA
jgi:hypothetical protein